MIVVLRYLACLLPAAVLHLAAGLLAVTADQLQQLAHFFEDLAG